MLGSSLKYFVRFVGGVNICVMHIWLIWNFISVLFILTENLSSDSAVSSPSALNSSGQGVEGLNRRRKKRTSIETNIRAALEKSFLEVSKGLLFMCVGCRSFRLWKTGLPTSAFVNTYNIVEKMRQGSYVPQRQTRVRGLKRDVSGSHVCILCARGGSDRRMHGSYLYRLEKMVESTSSGGIAWAAPVRH